MDVTSTGSPLAVDDTPRPNKTAMISDWTQRIDTNPLSGREHGPGDLRKIYQNCERRPDTHMIM